MLFYARSRDEAIAFTKSTDATPKGSRYACRVQRAIAF
jgi:hypothetical protein